MSVIRVNFGERVKAFAIHTAMYREGQKFYRIYENLKLPLWWLGVQTTGLP